MNRGAAACMAVCFSEQFIISDCVQLLIPKSASIRSDEIVSPREPKNAAREPAEPLTPPPAACKSSNPKTPCSPPSPASPHVTVALPPLSPPQPPPLTNPRTPLPLGRPLGLSPPPIHLLDHPLRHPRLPHPNTPVPHRRRLSPPILDRCLCGLRGRRRRVGRESGRGGPRAHVR